jgi:electron transfer flavoprotein alpha/beta subunit
MAVSAASKIGIGANIPAAGDGTTDGATATVGTGIAAEINIRQFDLA